MKSYGCVKCRTRHFENENLFNGHLIHQSKHGISFDLPRRQPNAEAVSLTEVRLTVE